MTELSPAQFFGRSRSRATRQASKPKPLSSSQENLIHEVKSVEKANKTAVKVKEVSVGVNRETRRNVAAKQTGSNRVATRARTASKQNNENENKKPSKVPSKDKKIPKEDSSSKTGQKISKRQTSSKQADTEDKKSGSEEIAPSGPVYQNVRRSDVVGNPFDEYDFIADENSLPAKKKRKPRKVNPSRKGVGSKNVAGWKTDFLKNVTKLPKVICPPTQQLKERSEVAKCQAKVIRQPTQEPSEKSSVNKVRNLVTSQPLVSSDPGIEDPDSGSLPSTGPQVHIASTKISEESQKVSSNLKSLTKNLINAPRVGRISSPGSFGAGNQFTSTPVAMSSAVLQGVAPSVSTPITSRIGSKRPAGADSLSSSSIDAKKSLSPAVGPGPSSNSLRTSTPAGASAKAGMPVAQSHRHQRLTPITLKSINVRESPSFRDPEPVSVSPPQSMSSSLMPATPCARSSALLSVPETHSHAAGSIEKSKTVQPVHFEACEQTPSRVTTSPVVVTGTPAKSAWTSGADETLSGLFDDIPENCKFSLPARMFVNHQGTIAPLDSEIGCKLPQLSPENRERVKRATAVKFLVPESSSVGTANTSSLQNCFGFDDNDDNEAIISVPKPGPSKVRTFTAQSHRNKNEAPSRNLPIQQVHALLMGHTKLSSPGNSSKSLACSTPRSVQTKLTDFISTPSASSRPASEGNPNILTPTPVPLFGEELMRDDLPSPFTQLSRRSYDRMKPVKRIACGDEVLSDDEVGDMIEKEVTQVTQVEKKKNKSYRKKKKPQDIQLDNWANELTSHFAEVEDFDLEIE